MGCGPSLQSIIDKEFRKIEENQTNLSRRHRLLVQEHINQDPFTKYEIVEELGSGNMGIVHIVKRKTGNSTREFAMKSIKLQKRSSAKRLRQLVNELQIVRDLDHPGIINFYEVYYQKPQVYVIMEFRAGGNLYGLRRRPYSEPRAANIIHQVLRAVNYLHQRHYVHRDIKFGNIMFESKTSDVVKLVDFGTCCRCDPGKPLRTRVGSLPTMAPEVFAGKCSFQCDMWSVGVVAFQLLCDEPPFKAPNPVALMTKIGNIDCSFESKSWRDKSNESKRFCKSLLVTDTTTRLTAAQALGHDWIDSSRRRINSTIDDETKKRVPKHLALYSGASQCMKMARIVMARRSDPLQVANLRNLFDFYDKRKRGWLTRDEIASIYGHSSDGALGLFEDAEFSYSEFLGSILTMENEHFTEERMVEALEALNVNSACSILGEDVSLQKLLEEFKKLQSELPP